MIVGSVGKRVGGWGLGYLIDMKKMRGKKKGVVGQEKMTGQLSLKLLLL